MSLIVQVSPDTASAKSASATAPTMASPASTAAAAATTTPPGKKPVSPVTPPTIMSQVPQPPTIAITSIAEQQTQQQQQQHIVQHHPPPLGGHQTSSPGSAPGELRMIQVPQQVTLPQSPVRPSALPPHSPLNRPPPRLPQLPQQPVGQRQLHQHQVAAAVARNRVSSGPPSQVMVNSSPSTARAQSAAAAAAATLSSMLPNAPSPGILPTAPPPSMANLIPFPVSKANLQPPGNLMPQPPVAHQSSKILPPNLTHPQIYKTPTTSATNSVRNYSRRRKDSHDE